MDGYSDNESEFSIPEVLSRDQVDEFDNGDLLDRRVNLEQNSVDRRFLEMNRQITDLTSLVLAVTEKISSTNREGNRLQTASNAHQSSKAQTKNTLNLALGQCALNKMTEMVIEIGQSSLP